jgi:hypothetical protein
MAAPSVTARGAHPWRHPSQPRLVARSERRRALGQPVRPAMELARRCERTPMESSGSERRTSAPLRELQGPDLVP